MRNFRASESATLLTKSGSTLASSIFFFLAGVSAGVFLELSMSPDEKGTVSSYLLQYFTGADAFQYPNPFFTSLFGNLLLLAIVFIAGLSVLGFPLALPVLLYKGMTLGFSASLLIHALAFKGALTVMASMVPQNIIIIPAFLASVTACQNYGLTKMAARRQGTKKSPASLLNSYVFLHLIFAAAIAVGCGIEALLFPIVV